MLLADEIRLQEKAECSSLLKSISRDLQHYKERHIDASLQQRAAQTCRRAAEADFDRVNEAFKGLEKHRVFGEKLWEASHDGDATKPVSLAETIIHFQIEGVLPGLVRLSHLHDGTCHTLDQHALYEPFLAALKACHGVELRLYAAIADAQAKEQEEQKAQEALDLAEALHGTVESLAKGFDPSCWRPCFEKLHSVCSRGNIQGNDLLDGLLQRLRDLDQKRRLQNEAGVTSTAPEVDDSSEASRPPPRKAERSRQLVLSDSGLEARQKDAAEEGQASLLEETASKQHKEAPDRARGDTRATRGKQHVSKAAAEASSLAVKATKRAGRQPKRKQVELKEASQLEQGHEALSRRPVRKAAMKRRYFDVDPILLEDDSLGEEESRDETFVVDTAQKAVRKQKSTKRSNERLHRMEMQLDSLRQEVDMLQRALNQPSQLGVRQSVRCAQQKSLKEAALEAAEQAMLQLSSELEAKTPERAFERDQAPGRHILEQSPEVREPSVDPAEVKRRAREQAQTMVEQCSSRAAPYAVLAACKPPPVPPVAHPVSHASQQVRRGRGDQRQAVRRTGGLEDRASFSQLKDRTQDLRFGRSAVHAWGLFAREVIPAGEFVIEYVGETIRTSLEDIREAEYMQSGLGSSYLFRVDNDSVVDATKRGGLARYINHSCDPNCYTRIVTVDGTKHIVIFSKKRILPDEELTYDYKFEYEADNEIVPCHCGAKTCTGRLN